MYEAKVVSFSIFIYLFSLCIVSNYTRLKNICRIYAIDADKYHFYVRERPSNELPAPNSS